MLRPLVEASYQELVRFVRYFCQFGTPIIIGGWAVFFYNPYYGSVDIDVIGPSGNGQFYEIIEGYERLNDYTITNQGPLGTEIIASKAILSKAGEKIGDMEIDACTYEQPAVDEFHEDNSKRLPYSMCEKEGCKRQLTIEKDCVCYVPSKPLLTLFKVKARRDRAYDIRTKGATMNPTRLAWLRSKVIKDGSDIVALLDPADRQATLKDEMDYGQMKALASVSNLTDLVMETLQEVLKDNTVMSHYGREADSKTILKHVAGLKT